MALVLAACESTPSDLRAWRPSDHNNTGEDDPERTPDEDPARRAGNAAATIWGSACVSCHGSQGRGDGPQAAMLRGVRDLTDPAWQASITDEQLAASIRNGKNRMPAFHNSLDDDAIRSMVAHVRSLRRGQ